MCLSNIFVLIRSILWDNKFISIVCVFLIEVSRTWSSVLLLSGSKSIPVLERLWHIPFVLLRFLHCWGVMLLLFSWDQSCLLSHFGFSFMQLGIKSWSFFFKWFIIECFFDVSINIVLKRSHQLFRWRRHCLMVWFSWSWTSLAVVQFC